MMNQQTKRKNVSVLFVCLGNICRSPTSEGVFRRTAARELKDMDVYIDSAGTANYHVGQGPDRRAIKAAKRRGVDISRLRARRVSREDYDVFDYIIAMDRQNLSDLLYWAPPDYEGQICLFLDYASHYRETEVPDPYYLGGGAFDRVLDMVEDASQGLVEDIRNRFVDL